MYHIIFVLIVIYSTISVLNGQLPPEFYDQQLSLAFDFPVGLTFDEEGYMYVWEKEGKVFVVHPDGTKQSEPLIDLSEEVSNWDDNGLMSFALDPYFSLNGQFYLLYVVDLHHYYNFGTPTYHPDTTVTKHATFGRLTSYRIQQNNEEKIADPGSRKILIGKTMNDGIPILRAFHGLGTVIVADDGTILVSVGNSSTGLDLGQYPEDQFIQEALEMGLIEKDRDIGSYRSQFLGSYGGKILRVDAATGNGLPSNPFFDENDPRSPESRIWASGFRNPFRITVMPNTGSHYQGDGQPGIIIASDVGDGRWEEINLVKEGGENFGWPIMEGPYWNWAFFQQPAPLNLKAPNPLFQTGECNQEFFSFRDLFQFPKASGKVQFTNPCSANALIDESMPTSIGTSPIISWSNQRWNPPSRAITPFFDDKGNLSARTLDDPNSSVEGDNFDGYSSLAGLFYGGDAFPETYRGKYFNLDHSGWIKIFEFDEAYNLQKVIPFHNDASQIIHMAENPKDGAIYYVSIQSGIHKITYGGGLPPTAVIKADKTFGPGPLSVQFVGSSSISEFSRITNYHWEFGDGQTSNAPDPVHQFGDNTQQIESYPVKLTVTDSLGKSDSEEITISVNNTPPSVRINSVDSGDRYPIENGTLLELSAEVEDLEYMNDDLAYEWKIFFHHNDHFHPEPVIRAESAYTILTPIGCEQEEYWYRIELTVIDPGGLSARDQKLIYPDCDEPFTSTVLTGAVDNEQIDLRWKTSNDGDVLIFEIQRSNDFVHFNKIGEVAPATLEEYNFIDVKPQIGNNIYRIKAISEDRAFRYSNLLTIPFPTPPDINLYPNPVFNQLNIEIKKASSVEVDFKIFSPNGQLLLQKQWDARKGDFFKQTLPLVNWTSGIYYYTIENGSQKVGGHFLISN